MSKTLWVVVGLVALTGGSPGAQRSPAGQFPPGFVDPQPVLAAAVIRRHMRRMTSNNGISMSTLINLMSVAVPRESSDTEAAAPYT